MGQQQLLLIVLAIVLVGIAIIMGITIYTEGSAKTNADALLQDALRISSEAQAWKQKPEFLGGSSDDTKSEQNDFSDLDFNRLGFSGSGIYDDGTCYQNANGRFALFPSEKGLGILAVSVSNQNMIGLQVTGVLSEHVSLYDASWNPVKGGYEPDGTRRNVREHQRCRGPGKVPMDVGG